ncbi:MAG: hypothetical protein ACJ78Q_18495 [Chloroflexia bacterium]
MRKNKVVRALLPLVGLKLSLARRWADMRIFNFGDLKPTEDGSVGQYALHIQCPWRIDGPEGRFTGRGDLWDHVSGKPMPDEWEPGIDDNVQDARLHELLQGYEPYTPVRVSLHELLKGTEPHIQEVPADEDPWLALPRIGTFINTGPLLVVEKVQGTEIGDATIHLSGGYRLILFPSGTKGEDWRVFQPGSDEPHFVVEAGSSYEA